MSKKFNSTHSCEKFIPFHIVDLEILADDDTTIVTIGELEASKSDVNSSF